MKETKTGGWIAGTVIVSLLLGVAGWFLLISPTFAAASETRTEAEAQVAQNDLTRSRISELKAQFEQIDTLTAELEGLQAQIPTTAELAEYRRQVAASAATHSVTVVALQTSNPTAVTPPAAPAPAADAPTEEGAAAPADGAATPPATADPAAVQASLYAIPVTIDVLGSYPNVLAFLADLQSAAPRLLAVETVTATAQQAAEAGGGKPATVPGDLGVVVSGYLFALPDTAPVVPDPAATPAPVAPLPVPDPARNPMVPLG